jgi:CheY-like chemotaxis protein
VGFLVRNSPILNLGNPLARKGKAQVRYDARKQVQGMKHRILLANDNDDMREIFQSGLEKRGLVVVPASTAHEALRLIATEKFNVLLSDLPMPHAGDGFTIVSAMRHTHPRAVTLVTSGYPALQEAMAAILLEADEVLVKPIAVEKIAELITTKVSNPPPRPARKKERVAVILERDAERTIQDWISRIEVNQDPASLPLSFSERTGPLPVLLSDLVRRQRLAPHRTVPVSKAACEHGMARQQQGYSVPIMVEESRALQVGILNTLQKNLGVTDFSTQLLDVMTIADEVDSHLKQSLIGYTGSIDAQAASRSV